MKRTIPSAALSLVSAAALAAEGNMVGNQTQNEGLFVVPAPGPVVIDGVIDPAEWDLSGQIWSFADWDSRDTFSVKTAAMWDRDYLYLAFDWRDPIPLNAKCNPREDPSHGWQCDAIQLRSITPEGLWTWITMWAYEGDKPAFDVEYPDKTERRDTRAMHRLLYPGKPGVWELGEGVAIGYRAADDGRGFTQEVRLPWSVFKPETTDATVEPGEVFKLGLEFYWAQPSGTGWPMHGYKDNLQPGVTKREFFWTSDNAWGNATICAEGNIPRRTYRRRSYRPEGAIALRGSVPAGSEFFSLVLNDAEGRRVRNVAGGCRVDEFTVAADPDGNPVVEVMWDGLDEAGAAVQPGSYRVATLGSGALDGWWETSFYNPGTPPWGTADGKGGWGADHHAVSRVARAGRAMVLCSAFAEGGYGTFAVDADGHKLWSDGRGSSVVAGNSRHVFIVPNDWEHTGDQILRIDAETGAYAPFASGGEMPLRLTSLLGMGPGAVPPKVLGLAATDEELVVLFGDNTIRVFDAANGAYRRGFVLHASQIARDGAPLRESGLGGSGELCPFAANAESAYVFFGRELRRMDLATGTVETVPLDVPVGLPAALALGPDGSVYVADGGPDQQVKKYAPDGALLARIGKTGGRALQGPFERDGMRSVTGIALDAAGRLWAAEDQRHPRRVSVWGPDGAFVRDFLGTTGYAGQGTTMHLDDPTRAYAELNEISIDPKTGAWDVIGTIYNPPPAPAGALVVRPGQTHFHNGEAFYSRASGEESEYFSVLGWRAGTAFFLMMRENGTWRPVAAIAPLASLLDLMGGPYNARVILDTHGEWAGHDPAEMVVWNDLDNDGYLTPDECEFVPPTASGRPRPGAPGDAQPRLEDIVSFFPVDNSPVSPEDLGFTAMRADPATGKRAWGRVVPVGFRDGGKPVYSARGFRAYENFGGDFDCESAGAAAIPGKDVSVGFLRIGGKVYVAGWRTSTGEILWRYASPFHSVHGSHDAPMPHTGLLIGCLKIVGEARGCGDSDVVMIRGNLGEDYFLTTDGFFINRLTRDGRLPGNPTPEDPALLRKTSFATLNGRGEPFSGTFTRHRDGVLRATFPFPANQAGNIVRIEGLDALRHGPVAPVEVTAADLARAAADNEQRALAASRPASPLRIARLAAGESPDWAEIPVAADIVREGLSTRTVFRAAAAPDALHLRWDIQGDASPWKNGARDWHLLFKGGDCVDFQLSPSGSAQGGDGDFRLLVAPFGDGNAVVLMRPRASGAPDTERFSFNSPVQTVVFDSVKRLAVTPEVEVGGDSVRVTLAVPWALLGMEAPDSGATLRGDVGVILSDAAGTVNTARVYRSNRHTNLVNDQPGEAILQPAGWSEVVFE